MKKKTEFLHQSIESNINKSIHMGCLYNWIPAVGAQQIPCSFFIYLYSLTIPFDLLTFNR